MKPKSMVLLLLAGACGMVAALAITRHLSGRQAPAGPPAEARKSVIVAAEDQDPGTQLKPDMLKVVEMPEQGLPEGTFSDLAQVTGQTVRFPIFKGELVLAAKLGGEKTLAQLMNNLPSGMRLATVHVADEAGRMTGLINPGNHVDVLWLPSRPDLQGMSVTTLMEDVQVVAVGHRINTDGPETTSKDSRTTEQNYTLLVKQEQSLRLVAASKNGAIRLSLRNTGDKSFAQVDEDSLDRLLGLKPGRSEKAQAAEPDRDDDLERYEIEIFKGGDLVVETFNVPEKQPSKN